MGLSHFVHFDCVECERFVTRALGEPNVVSYHRQIHRLSNRLLANKTKNIKTPSTRLFIWKLAQVNKDSTWAPHYWPFSGIHWWRRIFLTKNQWCKKSVYVMTPSWTTVIHWGRDKMAAIFADGIFNSIFLNDNARILLKISLKFVPKVRINSIPALVQIMAWRRPGDKPLSEPMLVVLPTHICVTQPQWDTGDNLTSNI